MYIPVGLLYDKNNEKEVYEIFDKLEQDLVLEGEEYTREDAIRDLEAHGEYAVIKELLR